MPHRRDFRLLLSSLAVSSCGDWLYNVALLAFVYERTGSATWLALTTVARVLPIVLLGPLAGVLADRWDRRRLIIVSDLVRAALMVALAAVAALGLPVVLAPLLAAAATVAGSVQPPSVAASTPRLVAAKDLQRANAARAAVGQGAIVAGPALGAVLLAATSPAVAILANAATFLASAVAIAAIPAGPAFRPARPAPAGPTSRPRRRAALGPTPAEPAFRPGSAARGLLAELREGADALRGAPTAVRVVAADVLCSAVYGVLTVALVLVARKVGAGPGGYGLLLGAFGVGGLAGAAVAGRLDSMRWRHTLALALGLVAMSTAALGVAGSLWLAIALGLVGGAGAVIAEVLSETALPRMLDDDVLARAYGIALPVSLAGIVAGSLIAGPLVALLGLAGALATTGFAVLALGALLLRRPLSVSPAIPVPAL